MLGSVWSQTARQSASCWFFLANCAYGTQNGRTAAPPCMFPAARCETQAPRELFLGICPFGIGRLAVAWCEMGQGVTGGVAKLRIPSWQRRSQALR